MDKIEYIERSLRCFWFSLLGLIPVLGVPFAVGSLVSAIRLRWTVSSAWNPAHAYHIWATILSVVGILATVLSCFGMAAAIVARIGQGN